MRNAAAGVWMGVVFWSVAGCTGGFEPVSWEPVDAEGIRDSFELPTGIVGPETLEAAIGYAETLGLFIGAVNHGLTPAETESSNGVVNGELAVIEGALVTGTNAYLKISCPGEDSENPVVDFSHGHIRLDSSSLTAVQEGRALPQWDLNGHGLLNFVSCDLNAVVFSGVSPFFVDTDNASLVIQMAMSATTGDVSSTVDIALIMENGGIAFSFPDALGDNVSVSYLETGEGLVFSVKGTNGAYSCLVAGGGVECSDPEGRTFSLGEVGS